MVETEQNIKAILSIGGPYDEKLVRDYLRVLTMVKKSSMWGSLVMPTRLNEVGLSVYFKNYTLYVEIATLPNGELYVPHAKKRDPNNENDHAVMKDGLMAASAMAIKFAYENVYGKRLAATWELRADEE